MSTTENIASWNGTTVAGNLLAGNDLAGNILSTSIEMGKTDASDGRTVLDEVYLILTCIILLVGSIGNLMVIGAVLTHR